MARQPATSFSISIHHPFNRTGGRTSNVGQNNPMEPNLETIQTAFAKMRADGWDLSSPLKWGFFFVHSSKEPLLRVFDEMKDHNYRIESLESNEDEEWTLQVSKTEVLAADKLHRRNIAFNELAEHCEVKLYDGWDVGQPDA